VIAKEKCPRERTVRRERRIKLRKVQCMLLLFLVVLLSLFNLDLADVEAATVLKVGYFEKNGFVAEEMVSFLVIQ